VAIDVAGGRYRDVLSGDEVQLDGPVAVESLVDHNGLALLERVQ
jgi:hypothetical protein